MPDKPLTVLTYAASASLAAVALVYFFNPNYLLDGDSSGSSASSRKKGIVGLFNPANDCFINSVLQSLAGLGDLRLYLIRESHRRELGGPEIYAEVPLIDSNGKEVNGRKLASLQSGEVTQGLKAMIDRLNERPIYKKTISAGKFINVLEHAFNTRISKSQQDAQELLQIVAERLSEEYHAGKEARKRAKKLQNGGVSSAEPTQPQSDSAQADNEVENGTVDDSTKPPTNAPTTQEAPEETEEETLTEEEDGFPLEGQTEARTECQHCQFVPKPNPTSFVMLNLTVPQKSSATLNECFDAHFKREYIDDYLCDKCRLRHAVEIFTKKFDSAKSEEQRTEIEVQLEKLRRALEEDPEKAPEGVELPDTKLAPKRKIARHVEITSFPKVLVIHLSRSLFDPRSSSTKNLAKVSFPERFPVGSILNRRTYKLLSVIAHKGTHNSGHYETFRRQHLYAPFSTPHVDNSSGPYSASATPPQSKTKLQSPKISIETSPPQENETPILNPSTTDLSPSTNSSSPSASTASHSLPSTRPSSGSDPEAQNLRISESSTTQKIDPPPPSTDLPSKDQPNTTTNQEPRPRPSIATTSKAGSMIDVHRFKRKKRPVDRWWRISDDKIKECKTAEVLAMQKEVYMLFYEMEKDGDDRG